jgi:hypothetical protein
MTSTYPPRTKYPGLYGERQQAIPRPRGRRLGRREEARLIAMFLVVRAGHMRGELPTITLPLLPPLLRPPHPLPLPAQPPQQPSRFGPNLADRLDLSAVRRCRTFQAHRSSRAIGRRSVARRMTRRGGATGDSRVGCAHRAAWLVRRRQRLFGGRCVVQRRLRRRRSTWSAR